MPNIRFAAPVGWPPGLDVMVPGDLRRLRLAVNFNGYRLQPDTWPWVRPGQAAPWSDPDVWRRPAGLAETDRVAP